MFFIPIFQNSMINREWQEGDSQISKTTRQREFHLFPKCQVIFQLLFVTIKIAIFFIYILDAVTSSRILKAKQKLGVSFNFAQHDVIELVKFSKMTMCRASEVNSKK